MGRQDRDQGQLFYEFNLEEVIPRDHLLRRLTVASRYPVDRQGMPAANAGA